MLWPLHHTHYTNMRRLLHLLARGDTHQILYGRRCRTSSLARIDFKVWSSINDWYRLWSSILVNTLATPHDSVGYLMSTFNTISPSSEWEVSQAVKSSAESLTQPKQPDGRPLACVTWNQDSLETRPFCHSCRNGQWHYILRLPGEFFTFSDSKNMTDPTCYISHLKDFMQHVRTFPPRTV